MSGRRREKGARAARAQRAVRLGGGAANVLVKHARLHYYQAFILHNVLSQVPTRLIVTVFTCLVNLVGTSFLTMFSFLVIVKLVTCSLTYILLKRLGDHF